MIQFLLCQANSGDVTLCCDAQTFKLASYRAADRSIRSVAWSQTGSYLSVGLGNGQVSPDGAERRANFMARRRIASVIVFPAPSSMSAYALLPMYSINQHSQTKSEVRLL